MFLHAALAGFILSVIYKFLDKKYSKIDDFHSDINWWMSFVVITASTIAMWVTFFVVSALSLPEVVSYVGYIFYFLLPFSIFKWLFDYKSKKAVIYSSWVPVISILSEIPFLHLRSAINT
jgi:uncharacterized membrane-anchored protein